MRKLRSRTAPSGGHGQFTGQGPGRRTWPTTAPVTGTVVAVSATQRPRFAVYCGARSGDDPAYSDAAAATGAAIAAAGADVVYGGGSIGLMGIVADTAVAGGSHVLGVMPELFTEHEIAHETIAELRIVEDMTVRKRIMLDSADAVIALPGGIGTLEELVEVLSWAVLRIHDKPIGLLNTGGFYDTFLAFLDHTVLTGFAKPAVRDLLATEADPQALVERLLDLVPRTAPAAAVQGVIADGSVRS